MFRPEVIYNIGTRGTQALGGVATIFLITIYLSETDQGFYYTIQSLAASYVLFELGLSNTLINFFSNPSSRHENKFSEFTYNDKDLFAGAIILYLGLSILAMFFLSFVGYFFLVSELRSDLIPIWFIIVASIAFNLNTLPHVVYIEAKGGVIDTNRMRLIQAFISLASLWIGLVLGFKLYALAIYFCSITLCQLAFIFFRKEHVKTLKEVVFSVSKVEYLFREVFSTQAKVSLTWLFGYFTSAGLVPVIMKMHGSEIAGQFGMALQVSNLLMMVCYAFISTRVPFWGGVLGRGHILGFERDFRTRQYISTILYLLGSILIISIINLVRVYDFGFAHRVLEAPELILIFLNGLITLSVLSDAAFIRINKLELHQYQSVSYSITLLILWAIFSSETFVSHLIIWLLCNIVLGFFLSKLLKQLFMKRYKEY